MNKKLLIITTNYSGCTCGKSNCECIKDTGVWLEEFAAPYFIFKKAGIDITVASPNGGLSPIDKNSIFKSNPKGWNECIELLKHSEKLSEISVETFNGIFLPGGYGPMFDLAENEELARVLEHFNNNNKVISAVCHGPAALILAKDNDGNSILNKKYVTSFTNEEENLSGLARFVPFMLESRIRELGANFVEALPWNEHVVVDENFVTGQNPQSAKLLAEKVLEIL